ncbi:hypothetical protein VCV18_008232 [Metarhizium anisopliae]
MLFDEVVQEQASYAPGDPGKAKLLAWSDQYASQCATLYWPTGKIKAAELRLGYDGALVESDVLASLPSGILSRPER